MLATLAGFKREAGAMGALASVVVFSLVRGKIVISAQQEIIVLEIIIDTPVQLDHTLRWAGQVAPRVLLGLTLDPDGVAVLHAQVGNT
jgi:hypothetical protein